MSIEIRYHGTMLSDYFQGTSGVMLPIYFDASTTIQDIFNILKREVSNVYEHISYTAEYHGMVDIDRVLKKLMRQSLN